MNDDDPQRDSRETFTKAPPVSIEPHAKPPEPVRAAFPGEEPPEGLGVMDLGPGGENEPNIRLALLGEPFEKKPFYHFRPGSYALSIATQGCNFHCDFCQNWQIAQAHREGIVPETRFLPPDMVVEEAVGSGVIG